MIIAKQFPTHPLSGFSGLGVNIARQFPTRPLSGLGFRARDLRRRSFQPIIDLRALRGPLDIFESPVWEYRKWIVVGGVALIGLSLLAGGAALLK